MTGVAGGSWPTAELDPVRRLKVLAGAGAGGRAAYAERYFDLPPDEVWRVVSDLERELPLLISGVRSFTPAPDAAARAAAAGEGGGLPERFTATAVSRLRHRELFEVALRPGWCLMQSRMLVGGMAATAEGPGTRFALMYSLRFPGGAGVLRLLGAGARAGAMLDRLGGRLGVRRAG